MTSAHLKIDTLCFLHQNRDSTLCLLLEAFEYKNDDHQIAFILKHDKDVKRIISTNFTGVRLTIDGENHYGKPLWVFSSFTSESEYFYSVVNSDNSGKIIVLFKNEFILMRTPEENYSWVKLLKDTAAFFKENPELRKRFNNRKTK